MITSNNYNVTTFHPPSLPLQGVEDRKQNEISTEEQLEFSEHDFKEPMVTLPYSQFQEIINKCKAMENNIDIIENEHTIQCQVYTNKIKSLENRIIEVEKVNAAVVKTSNDTNEKLNCVTDDNRQLKIISGVIGVAAIICVGYISAPVAGPVIVAKISILKAGSIFLFSKQTLAGVVAATTIALTATSKAIPLGR